MSGLSALVEEEKTGFIAKSKLKGNRSSPGVKPISFKNTKHGKVFTHNVTSIPEAKEAPYQISPVMRKRRQKPSPSKVRIFVTIADAIFHVFTLLARFLYSMSLPICKLLTTCRFQKMKSMLILIWVNLKRLRCVVLFHFNQQLL